MANVSVVVPCYNEATRLDTRAFSRFQAAGHRVEFLFVNDGSSDQTAEVLERMRCASPDTVRVLHQRVNQGKAEAVRVGLLNALGNDAEYVGFWDADLATPLASLPEFLDVLEGDPGIEMVFGSRVKLLGRHVERQTWRHYSGRVFATIVSAMLRLPIYDTQCGAKMFRSTDTLRTILAEPFLTTWLFDVEILARYIERVPGASVGAARAIYELPLREWRDVGGSKLTRRAYARAAASLLKLHRSYGRMLKERNRRP